MELKSPFSEHLDRAGWALPTSLMSVTCNYRSRSGPGILIQQPVVNSRPLTTGANGASDLGTTFSMESS